MLYYLVNGEWECSNALSDFEKEIKSYWDNCRNFKFDFAPESRIVFADKVDNERIVYAVDNGTQTHLFTRNEIYQSSPEMLLSYFQNHISFNN